jgi:hypothetical protein
LALIAKEEPRKPKILKEISEFTSCFVDARLYVWEDFSGPAKDVELKLQPCDEVLVGMEDIGPQSCLLFSDDGKLLASGGKVNFSHVSCVKERNFLLTVSSNGSKIL